MEALGQPVTEKSFADLADDFFEQWTDKARCYGIAIAELKKEGELAEKTQHRHVKYLNSIVEADHGKLKRLIRPTLGFKTMKTAYATIKGFEIMRALKKGQARPWRYQKGIMG